MQLQIYQIYTEYIIENIYLISKRQNSRRNINQLSLALSLINIELHDILAAICM